MKGERGIYLPLLALLLVGLLAVIGFIIDIGTLERTQLQLQKAVDAGVIAGLDYRIQIGYPTAAEEPIIKDRLEKFVRQNLQLKGFDTTSTRLGISGVNYNNNDTVYGQTGSETLEATVSYDTPYLLMPLVPLQMIGLMKTPSSRTITATAKAVVPRVNIIMVLDTSNSMGCPADDANCACADPNLSTTPCDVSAAPYTPPSKPSQVGRAKIYDLRRGVWDFLGRFRAGRDRIALVTFDLVANTVVGFDNYLANGQPGHDGKPDGFQEADFLAKLGRDDVNGGQLPVDFTPGGLTNPSDGILTAFQQLSDVGLMSKEKVALVFFTDGAPTAKIGCYSKGTGGLTFSTNLNSTACPIPGKEFVDFEVEWVYPNGDRVRGPSPLMLKSTLAAIPRDQRVPSQFLMSGGVPDTSKFASCSGLAVPEAGTPPTTINAWKVAYQKCLADFSSFLPDGTESEKNYALHDDAKYPDQNFKKAFFHRALAVADWMQHKNVLFYTIGIGAKSAGDPKTDPYETMKDDFNRKDGFLMNLANDVSHAPTDLKAATCPAPPASCYPQYGFADYDPWEQRIDDENSKKWDKDGLYVKGYSSDGIEQMFELVAKKIQLRFLK